jgi:hypothetical protein
MNTVNFVGRVARAPTVRGAAAYPLRGSPLLVGSPFPLAQKWYWSWVPSLDTGHRQI